MIQLVGDDFSVDQRRLRRGLEEGCANSILVKVNQIGTLTETFEAVRLAQHNGHTQSSVTGLVRPRMATIADPAVAVNAGQIKTGARAGPIDVQHNQLDLNAEELGELAEFGPTM